MIGGQYDVYPYFVPLAVAQFAQDTHSPSFGGRIEVRDWIGGHVFYRLEDFLVYFRDIAVQNNYAGCTDVALVHLRPALPRLRHPQRVLRPGQAPVDLGVHRGPQHVGRRAEGAQHGGYIIVRNYTDDVVFQLDDGAFPGGAYSDELPMKYFLDSFNQYN